MRSAHWFVLCEADGCGRSTEPDGHILVQDTEGRKQGCRVTQFCFCGKDKVLANKTKQKPNTTTTKKTVLFYNPTWLGTLH